MEPIDAEICNCNCWQTNFKSARYVVAPMVDQSELAWRLLSRRYGAQLCYSPMIHASIFVKDATYRLENMKSCDLDRPLIFQFCANDPELFLQSAKLVEDCCDGVDLNLGCPQAIARRGRYGAFLQDDWELLTKIVSKCRGQLKIPISCKIRIFPSLEKTVAYAKMLENAGCQLLTVHGRTREQKGINTGIASWPHIKAVREAVKIPMFANGNIRYFEDIERCLKATGVEGVMSAEGNLHNPAIFSPIQSDVCAMCLEYLDLVDQYPCPLSYVRGHLFKLCHHALQIHTEARDKFGLAKNLAEFRNAVVTLKLLYQSDVKAYEKNGRIWTGDLPWPYWICQPYVRPIAELDASNPNVSLKRISEVVVVETGLSRNKLKKLRRNPNKTFVSKRDKFVICKADCGNPKSDKCDSALCRKCCLEIGLDCTGHKKSWHKVTQRTNDLGSVLSTNELTTCR